MYDFLIFNRALSGYGFWRTVVRVNSVFAEFTEECMWLACGRVLGVIGMHNCLEFDFQYGS